jgi:hypothetical protein
VFVTVEADDLHVLEITEANTLLPITPRSREERENSDPNTIGTVEIPASQWKQFFAGLDRTIWWIQGVELATGETIRLGGLGRAGPMERRKQVRDDTRNKMRVCLSEILRSAEQCRSAVARALSELPLDTRNRVSSGQASMSLLVMSTPGC